MDKLLPVFRSACPNLSGNRIFTLLLLFIPVLTFASGGGHQLGALIDLLIVVGMFIIALICLLTFGLTLIYRKSQSQGLAITLYLLNLLLLYVIISVLREVIPPDSHGWSEDCSSEFRNLILEATSVPIITILYFIWVTLKKRGIV